MKKLLLYVIVGLSSIVNGVSAFGQEAKHNQFTIGAQYQNRMQYLGRTDSLTIPLIVPNARFSTKGGLFLEGEGYFNLNDHKVDGGYVAAGYEFDKGDWNGGAAVSKYFFDTQSRLIKSAISTSIGGYLSYNAKVVTLNVEPNFSFGDGNTDFVLGAGLTKEISADHVFKSGSFSMTPSAYVWFGTQSFAESHYTKHRGKGAPTTTTSENFKTFQPMSLEFSLPVKLGLSKHVQLLATPLLAIPENTKGLDGYYGSASYPKSIFIFKGGVAFVF